MWKIYEMNEEIKFYEKSAVITSNTVYREIDTNLDNATYTDETNTLKLTEKKTVYYIADYLLLKKKTITTWTAVYIYIYSIYNNRAIENQ